MRIKVESLPVNTARHIWTAKILLWLYEVIDLFQFPQDVLVLCGSSRDLDAGAGRQFPWDAWTVIFSSIEFK